MLETRRRRGDEVETSENFMTLREKFSSEQFFHLSSIGYHSLKLKKHHPGLDLRKHLFSQPVIIKWNSLLPYIIEAPLVNMFKSGLYKHPPGFNCHPPKCNFCRKLRFHTKHDETQSLTKIWIFLLSRLKQKL